ncbi:MAG TPA: DUF4350 domain-containing protein [Polyangiaceae bacterium]|nr:DUF4350 domain-containing protein [Polyangiaceae bacterium]
MLHALAVCLAATFVSSIARAAFDFRDPSWEGTSELLALARDSLGAGRVKIVAKLDFDTLTPRDGVLVLHPEVELQYPEVSAFLSAGGRLALLDDHGKGDLLLARYRIYRVQAPLRPAATLRNNAGFALALPAVQAVAGQEQNRHPSVSNVERLVTNHPTALTNPNLTPVLTIPALGEPDATLAITGVIAGKGRLFAMADPSSVINLMLRYPGNRAFASGLIEYLVEDDSWGPRSGTLYLVANRFNQGGRFGGGGGLTSDLSDAAETATSTLASWHEEGIPIAVALALGALCLLGALGWTGHFALRPYRRPEPRYASATTLVAQGGLPGRAAVLAAPTTDRALVLTELDGLLEDELSQRLDLPDERRGGDHALEALRANGEPPALLQRVRELRSQGAAARTAVMSRQASRLTAGQVAEYAKKLTAVLADLDRSRK